MLIDQLTQLSVEALLLILRMSAPLVGAAAILGLALGFLQAVTQLQDQTTSFTLKLLVVMGLIVILLPWLGGQLLTYSERLFELAARVKV